MIHDTLGQTFNDCSLTNSWLADERRVILRQPGKNLHHALDLVLAANDRKELVVARGLRQVGAEGIDVWRLGRRLTLLAVGAALVDDLDHLCPHLLQADAEALKNARRDALTLTNQPEQQMLRSNVVMVLASRFVERKLNDASRPWGKPDLALRRAFTAPDDELYGGSYLLELYAHVCEHARGNAIALTDKTQQQMLGADIVVIEAGGFLVREAQHLPRSLRELVESLTASLAAHDKLPLAYGDLLAVKRRLRHDEGLAAKRLKPSSSV